MQFKKFGPDKRGHFIYWCWHWVAFQYVAIDLRAWRPRFLFHDIEKPFLMLLWKDYKRVQQYHRNHSRHHLEYKGKKEYDWLGMLIDWECAHLTKIAKPLNAIEKLRDLVKKNRLTPYQEKCLYNEFNKYF